MTGVRQYGKWAPVLCYHSINDTPYIECDPLPVANFERHIRHLKENYNIISVDDLVDGIFGNKVLPDRPVAITFDDGYVDNFTNAYPIIQKYSIPVTFFLATRFVSGKIRLVSDPGWEAVNWKQVNYMLKNGSGLISVGAHTRNHCIVSNVSSDQLHYEIYGSRDDIITQTNIKPSTFAFPNGQATDISKIAIETIKSAGFNAAFSTIWSTRHSPKSKWCISRIMVSGDDDVDELDQKLNGEYDYLFYWHNLKPLFKKVDK